MLHSPFPHVLPIHATLRSLCQLSDFSLFSVFFLISFAFPALSLSRLAPLTRLNSPLPRSWNHFPRCHPPNVNCGIGCFLGCFHLFPRVLPQQKQLEAPTTGLRVVVKRDGRSVVERKGALVLSFCACAPNLALDSRRFDVLFCRRSCQAANRQSCDDTRSTTPAAGETIARAPLPTINACVFRELRPLRAAKRTLHLLRPAMSRSVGPTVFARDVFPHARGGVVSYRRGALAGGCRKTTLGTEWPQSTGFSVSRLTRGCFVVVFLRPVSGSRTLKRLTKPRPQFTRRQRKQTV